MCWAFIVTFNVDIYCFIILFNSIQSSLFLFALFFLQNKFFVCMIIPYGFYCWLDWFFNNLQTFRVVYCVVCRNVRFLIPSFIFLTKKQHIFVIMLHRSVHISLYFSPIEALQPVEVQFGVFFFKIAVFDDDGILIRRKSIAPEPKFLPINKTEYLILRFPQKYWQTDDY